MTMKVFQRTEGLGNDTWAVTMFRNNKTQHGNLAIEKVVDGIYELIWADLRGSGECNFSGTTYRKMKNYGKVSIRNMTREGKSLSYNEKSKIYKVPKEKIEKMMNEIEADEKDPYRTPFDIRGALNALADDRPRINIRSEEVKKIL